MASAISCHALLNMMCLWAIIIQLVSVGYIVEGTFVVINNSGRDVEADCGEVSWTIAVGERTVVAAAIDGDSEVLDPNLVKHRSGHRCHHVRQTCRVGTGNYFVSWDPVQVAVHSIGEFNSDGDYEWAVDNIGVSLVDQSIKTGRRCLDCKTAGKTVYEAMWQSNSPHFSGATQCASTSSRLAQAFYTVFLYFRE